MQWSLFEAVDCIQIERKITFSLLFSIGTVVTQRYLKYVEDFGSSTHYHPKKHFLVFVPGVRRKFFNFVQKVIEQKTIKRFPHKKTIPQLIKAKAFFSQLLKCP